MKNLFLVVVFIFCAIKTNAQIIEATPTIPTNEYIDLLTEKFIIPDSIKQRYANADLNLTIVLTITKEGSVFNPRIKNDSLQLTSNLKKAFETLPKWNPKTENGNAITALKVFNLAIFIPDTKNNITANAKPVDGIENFYRQFIRKFNIPHQINKDEIKIRVGLFIKKDGSISNIVILESNEPDLNKEVIRVLKTMPNWQPTLKNGLPIDTFHVLPIMIKVRNQKDLDYYNRQFQQ